MKAIQFDRLGGAEVMELREVPKPELQARNDRGQKRGDHY